jgi:hypothetical protein
VYPNKYRSWNTDEVLSVQKSIKNIYWKSLDPLVKTIKESTKYPIYIAKVEDDSLEASSEIFDDKMVLFLSNRLLKTDTQYHFSSEKTHTITHELMHFYINIKYRRDYFLGEFWIKLVKATDWSSARDAHYLTRTDTISQAFKRKHDLIQLGKKSEALNIDIAVARGYGFPSLYSMTKIEEFVAELYTYLIYDPHLSDELSQSIYDFVKTTEFGNLLKSRLPVSHPPTESVRTITKSYEFVGRMFLESQPTCTVFLIAHGKAVTAKHCFKQIFKNSASLPQMKNSFSPLFKETRISDETKITHPAYISLEFYSQKFPDPILITGLQIESFYADSGQNDWAYIDYDPKVTEGLLKIPKIELSTLKETKADDSIYSVGYFLPQKVQTQNRFISRGVTTGLTGSLEKILPEYEGILQDSTLPGWYLASGSPIFRGQPDQNDDQNSPIELLGILSHTFEVLEDGSLDNTLLKKDFWGNWTKANFSLVPSNKE